MNNNEKIQVAAYYLWQKNGCPEGRSEEFWYKAVSQISKASKITDKKEPWEKKISKKKKSKF